MIVEDGLGPNYYFTSKISESPIVRMGSNVGSYALEHKYKLKSQLDNPFDVWRVVNGEKSAPYKSAAFKRMIIDLMQLSRVSNAVDSDSFALELALAESFGTYHPLINTNLRLYFNPIIGKFQPIATDATDLKKFYPQPDYLITELKKSVIWSNLLAEKSFLSKYQNAKKIISSNVCNFYRDAYQSLSESYRVHRDIDLDCKIFQGNLRVDFNK